MNRHREIYLQTEQQLGASLVDMISNPDKFEQELKAKIALYALLTAGFFVGLNLIVFRRRG